MRWGVRNNPATAVTDEAWVKDLIRQSPWATLVSHTDAGLVASHYPFLLDESADGIVLQSHVGRPDEDLHRLGTGEVLVIFAGPHGYISPGWYGLPHAVPTWNFAVVHAYGVPELLDVEANLRVLERLVDRFEDALPAPYRMRGTTENSRYADRIVHGTLGFSMPVTRFVAKEKMSQDKSPEAAGRIIDALRAPGPYQQTDLADRMAAIHDQAPDGQSRIP